LEQFDILEDGPKPQGKRIRAKKTIEKRNSAPHFEISAKLPSPQNFVLNVRKGLLSPTKITAAERVIHPVHIPTRQETELIEANHLTLNSLSPRRSTLISSQTSQGSQFELIPRRGSTLVVQTNRDGEPTSGGFPSLITPRRIGEQQPERTDLVDSRRFSSPVLIGGPQFRAGLPAPLRISKELKLNFVPNSFRDSPLGSKNLDTSPGLSPSKGSTRSGTLASNIFDSKQGNAGPRTSWTIENPSLLPISNDYLLKIILNKTGGSHPGSHTGSPISPGTPENSSNQGYQVKYISQRPFF
jgi:hypothetical protein